MKAMTLRPRGTLTLKRKMYGGDVRVRPVSIVDDVAERDTVSGGIKLEIHRDDCKKGPAVVMSLDDARLLQRALQSAIDEEYRRQKEAFKAAARELEPEGDHA